MANNRQTEMGQFDEHKQTEMGLFDEQTEMELFYDQTEMGLFDEQKACRGWQNAGMTARHAGTKKDEMS